MSKRLRTGPHWYERIQHILERIDKVQALTTGITFAQFRADTNTQDLIIRHMEIIGEAGAYIPQRIAGAALKEKLETLLDYRNKIAHGYYAIDFEKLWEHATHTILPLHPAMQQLQEQHKHAYRREIQLNTIASTAASLTENKTLTTHNPLLPVKPTPTGCKGPTFDLFLHGRAAEFNFLARRLQKAPTSVATVTGPPGFGTTALLHAVERYANHLDHTVVQLEPNDLASCIKIAEKCHAAVTTSQDQPNPPIPSSQENPPAELITRAHELLTELGGELEDAKQRNDTPYTFEAIDLIQHLRAICHSNATPHRILITCDDIHQVANFSRNGRRAVRHNLSIFTRGVNHPNVLLPITTILAGHPLDPQIRQEILTPAHNQDPSVLQLTTIPPEYSCRILYDHLNNSEHPPQLPHFFDAENIAQWGNQCHGYPPFAVQLGQIICDYALQRIRQGQTNATPRDYDNINTKFHQLQTLAYDQCLSTPSTPNTRLMDLLTHCLVAASSPEHVCHRPNPKAPPQPLTLQKVHTLANNMLRLELPHQNLLKHTEKAHQLIQELQQRNIIHLMPATPDFLLLDLENHPADRMIFPLPGIIAHIGWQSSRLDSFTKERISSIVQETQENLATTETRGNTRWQWNNTIKRTPIPFIFGSPQQSVIHYEDTPKAQPPRQENIHGLIDPQPNPHAILPKIIQPRRPDRERNR